MGITSPNFICIIHKSLNCLCTKCLLLRTVEMDKASLDFFTYAYREQALCMDKQWDSPLVTEIYINKISVQTHDPLFPPTPSQHSLSFWSRYNLNLVLFEPKNCRDCMSIFSIYVIQITAYSEPILILDLNIIFLAFN